MLTLKPDSYPNTLINVRPMPKQIYVRGASPSMWLDKPRVAIIGTRKPTAYGQTVTKQFASELARRGVVIVSGLALGSDGIALQSAVDAGGITIAVLPSAINQIYPRSNNNIANSILENHGSLISEFPDNHETPNFKYAFVARNRIIAGLSDAVIIPEASLGSGSLHTADFALDLGVPVLSVPGSIYSELSEGTNHLIKSGSQLVTSYTEVLEVIGYSELNKIHNLQNIKISELEIKIIECIKSGKNHEFDLANKLKIHPSELASNLSLLEINGLIKSLGNGQWVAI